MPTSTWKPLEKAGREQDGEIAGIAGLRYKGERVPTSRPRVCSEIVTANILFLNFEGMYMRVAEDVKAIWDICEAGRHRHQLPSLPDQPGNV